MPREIRWLALTAEKCRQIGNLVGAAQERHAEMRAEPLRLATEAAGDDHPRSPLRQFHPALDDFLGHQRSDLDAGIDDLPVEFRLAQAGHDLFEPRFGEAAREEYEPVSHLASVRSDAA